jgi:hypothetical protein
MTADARLRTPDDKNQKLKLENVKSVSICVPPWLKSFMRRLCIFAAIPSVEVWLKRSNLKPKPETLKN